MLRRELAESRDDMALDNLCLLIGLGSIVRNDRRTEISVIDRIVDRDCNLKSSFVREHATRNASPHRGKTTEGGNVWFGSAGYAGEPAPDGVGRF
jgi:hypothetical protein